MTLWKSTYKVEHSTKNVLSHIKYAFSHTFSHSLLATFSQRDIVSYTFIKGTLWCLLATTSDRVSKATHETDERDFGHSMLGMVLKIEPELNPFFKNSQFNPVFDLFFWFFTGFHWF